MSYFTSYWVDNRLPLREISPSSKLIFGLKLETLCGGRLSLGVARQLPLSEMPAHLLISSTKSHIDISSSFLLQSASNLTPLPFMIISSFALVAISKSLQLLTPKTEKTPTRESFPFLLPTTKLRFTAKNRVNKLLLALAHQSTLIAKFPLKSTC